MSVAAWQVVGVSVVGSSHLTSGRGCDDAHCYRQLDDGTLLIAIADGAGSMPRSAEGAACVVQAAITAIEQRLGQHGEPPDEGAWEAMLAEVLREARAALESLAFEAMEQTKEQPLSHESAQPLGLNEFATTLLVTSVTPNWIAVAQIGDGAVVVQWRDGSLDAMTTPDHGEYLNESTFVTSSQYLDHAQYAVHTSDQMSGVALFSDGLQMLALNIAANEPHAPFFVPLFAFAAEPDATAEELAEFLNSERVCAETDDDKTLVLAVRL